MPLIARDDADATAAPAASLPETLAQVYDAHFDFVWRNARRLGVSESSAEDVTQDVFMIVQRRIGNYDGRASMQAWILGILVSVVRDHRRAFRLKGSRNLPLGNDITRGLGVAPGPMPVEQAEHAERARLLDKVLGELDEDERTLLILSELEEWTLREMAEFYDSNTNTIHSRLRAAKHAFEQAYLRSQAGKEELP